jgi:hypothetical protein
MRSYLEHNFTKLRHSRAEMVAGTKPVLDVLEHVSTLLWEGKASGTTTGASICEVWWITTHEASSSRYRLTCSWYKSYISCTSCILNTPPTTAPPARVRCRVTHIWTRRTSWGRAVVEVILPSASQTNRIHHIKYDVSVSRWQNKIRRGWKENSGTRIR